MAAPGFAVGGGPGARWGVEVEEALSELRQLAHGIDAPALARWRLSRALEPLVARYHGKVKVIQTTAARFPPEVEAAVYYCCLEAVQNAVKHAGQACTSRSACTATPTGCTSRSTTTDPALTPPALTTASDCRTCAIDSAPCAATSRSPRTQAKAL